MRVTVIGLSLLMVAMVNAEQKYLAVFPKELRNGMPFEVDITLTEPASGLVQVYVSIRKGESVTSELVWNSATATINIDPGQTSNTGSVEVPFDIATGEQFYVHLSFTGLKIKPRFEKVVVTRPSAPIVIVLDKPVYNPGQTVLFRVLLVDMYLKPVNNKQVTMEIKDGNKNSIMKVMSKPNSEEYGDYGEALVDGNFTLSDDPVLGFYTIIAMTDDDYTEKKFEVMKYVLPKFEVILELDQSSLISGGSTTISGKVRAKYSYGKNVKGTAVVKVAGTGRSLDDNAIVWTKENFEGSALFTASVEIDEVFSPWMYEKSFFNSISAEVTEENTDQTEFKNVTLPVYQTAFEATVKKPMPHLFSGQTTYTFQVELTMHGGLKDGEDSIDLSQYVLFYKAESDQDYFKTSVTSNPQNVTLKMKTSDTSLSENAVHVYYEYIADGKKIQSPYVKEKISKYYTWSNQSISVQLIPSNIKTERCFKIVPFKTGDKAYYKLVNNYFPEQKHMYTNPDGHCFTVEQKHAPKTRIVVLKLVDYIHDGVDGTELLTAHVDLVLAWTPEQMVTVAVTSEQGEEVLRPGEVADIVIQTSGQAIVGVKGVDKSVGFMADAVDITRKGLLHLIEAFRLFDRKNENKFPNPPMFPMPMFQGRPMARKKRCSACITSDQYMDSKKLLQEAGLTILTDLDLKRQELFETNKEAQNGPTEADEEVDVKEEQNDDGNVRDEFPETWLWDIVMTNTNGVANVQKKAPDTITSWEVSAFAMNNENGLSVSDTVEITVFQPFFISMNLPYSVVRTENVEIDILVFNYKDTELTVAVELEPTENYTILDKRATPRIITIAPSSSGLATWLVMFTTIGDIPLKAKATEVGTNNIDRVKRPLIVKPEGREIRDDDNLKAPGDGVTEMQFNMSKFFKTKGYVPGSLRMYIHVTGDMMGVFISNIIVKIRMPFGCGEQNIKSLTPSVFIARYLKQIGRLDQKVEALVGKVCGAGYRKELNYLHADGSYSAFGDRPNMCMCGSAGKKWGSTWLTAYVLKVFSLMYMDEVTYVSPETLKKSFDYIKNNVTYKDCQYQYVVEKGELIHTEMQGGTATRIGLVAFVLVSVMDYRDAALKAGLVESAQEAADFIAGSSGWLKAQMDELKSSKNTYQMAIVAYALSRASPDSVDSQSDELLSAIETILSDETSKDDLVPTQKDCLYKPGSGERKDCTKDPSVCSEYQQCCQVACEGKRMCSPKPYQPTFRHSMPEGTTSSMIETKGYALMAYLELYTKEKTEMKKADYKEKVDDLKDWLLSQRKGNGFFSSTQDTVVALEALSRYAITFPNTNGGNFKVRAKADGNFVTDEVSVDSVSYTVTTEAKLDVDTPPSDVSVVVSGTSGTAFVNLVALYNVAENVTTPPYNIIIEPRRKDDKPFIRFCFQKDPNFTGQTGTMVVSMLNMQTGVTMETIEAEDLSNPDLSAARYDVSEDGSVNLYYMEGDNGFTELRCNHIYVKEQFTVENRQPAPARVMDYYRQENSVESLYSVDANQGTEFTTTPVTIGASSAHVNMFLLIGVAFLFMLNRFTVE